MHPSRALIGALLLGCGGSSATEPPVDAAVSADGGAVGDPFCAGRPLLTFCEDFEERPLPGAFAEQIFDAASASVERDATAPSAPRALVFALDRDRPARAWLRTASQAASVQAAAFFFVRVDALGSDLEVAAFEDASGYRVALAVAADGTVGMTESGGVHASSDKLEAGTWTAIRWDVRFVDNTLTARLRIGSKIAFAAEPLELRGKQLTATFSVGGARNAAGAALRIAFDSVTFELPGAS